MFDLHSITMSNFRSYRKEHTFEFPTKTGLYFFTGQNNTALGSNGAGKSTLLDAIVWALYGRTARGLKANEVISWGAASAQVTLELTVGTKHLVVKRTQKPNGLLLNDKPVDQKELEKHLRLNFDSFIYSVINTQFGESFLALSPAAKLVLFSDIMGLDYWLEKSDEASKQTKALEAQLEHCERLLSRHEGEIDTIVDDVSSLEEDSRNFKHQQQLKLTELKKEEARIVNAQIELAAEISDWPRPDLAPLIKQRNKELDTIQKAASHYAEIGGELKALRAQMSEFKELKGNCPTCLQPVNKGATHATLLEDMEKEALTLELSMDLVKRRNIEAAKKRLITLNLKIDADTDTLNELKEKKADSVAFADRLKAISARKKEIAAETDPYQAMLKAKQAKLKALNAALTTDKDNKHTLEAAHAAILFWVKGFKRVRLFLIEQAFRTLEIEVNNSLSQLGMEDWQITFDVERENKSGGVTKGFATFVQSPVNKEPVKWESWSGGETQRLQLAGDLGLANLIMQQAGLSNTIEFYDEPSTHLSPEGMMDLANMLHERAVSEGKRIWIVDHASITNFGEFNGIITARRDKHGSRISFSGAA